MSPRLEVVGLGLMGLSLALAVLRQGWEVYGLDVDPAALDRAVRLGVRSGPAPRADWIVLAVPPRRLAEALAPVADRAAPGTAVTELTSVKGEAVTLLAALPATLSVISSHPMAGSEAEGGAGARADLYRDRPWAAIPVPGRAPPVGRLADLVAAVGAQLVWVESAAHHDRAVALTSHLPYLAALMLSSLAGKDPTARQLVGPSLLSATRTALSPAALWADILTANRTLVREALRDLIEEAEQWETQLAAVDPQALEAALRRMRAARQEWPKPFG